MYLGVHFNVNIIANPALLLLLLILFIGNHEIFEIFITYISIFIEQFILHLLYILNRYIYIYILHNRSCSPSTEVTTLISAFIKTTLMASNHFTVREIRNLLTFNL